MDSIEWQKSMTWIEGEYKQQESHGSFNKRRRCNKHSN